MLMCFFSYVCVCVCRMVDNVVLKFQYLGKEVDVVVEDVDKVVLVDLIMEYEEKFRKKGFSMPENPSFEYVFKMKHVMINTDKDLMTMFERLSDKGCINIWVGRLDQQTASVSVARSLAETLEKGSSTHEPTSKKQSDLVIEGPFSSPNPPKSRNSFKKTPVQLTLGKPPFEGFPNDKFNHSLEWTWTEIQVEPFPSSDQLTPPPKTKAAVKRGKQKNSILRRSPRHTSAPTSFSNAPDSSEVVVVSTNNVLPSSSKRPTKLPRSTAVRRGLLIPRKKVNLGDGDGSSTVNSAAGNNDGTTDGCLTVYNEDTLELNEVPK